MAKSKTYELMLKICGKVDSSLKEACLSADKNLRTLGSAAKTAAKVAAAAGTAAVTGAAAAAASSLSEYSDFQSAMDATAVTARASEEEYALMEAAARRMGAATTKTATEAAEAMGYMSLAGWDVQQSLTGLEPILRLSEATNMDLARASDLVTDSMSALGIGVEGMEDYLNLSVQAQRASNTTAEMLMEAFIGCGGAAKTAGVDMGDLSTALGVLANSGTKGAEAGTALNSIIMRMTSKDAAIQAMKSLGVSVYNASGEFRGLETILTDVSAAMSGMSADDKMAALAKIAGTNYATEMSYLLDAVAQGADGAASAWSTLEADVMDHSGVLLEVAKANTDNLKGAAAIFKSAVSELQLQVGEQLAPYAQEGLTYLAENVLPAVSVKLGEILPKVIQGAKWTWENRSAVLAIASGLLTVITAFKGLQTASAAVGAVRNLSTVFRAASQGGGLLSKVLGMGSVKLALIAGGAALLAAGFVTLWNRSERFRGAVSGVLASLGPLGQACLSLASVAAEQLGPALGDIGGALLGGLETAVVLSAPVIQTIIGVLTGLLTFVTGVFSGNWAQAWQGICDAFGALFGNLPNLAKAPINAVISTINHVLGKINGISVTIPDWVPGVGGKTLGFSLPTIPMLASGGIVTAPTILEAGEGGEPEAILPLSRLAALLDRLPGNRPPEGGGAPDFPGLGEGWPDLPGKNSPSSGKDSGGGDRPGFTLVFNFYGNAGEAEAREAARMGFQEFKRLYRQLQDEERRKNFQRA